MFGKAYHTTLIFTGNTLHFICLQLFDLQVKDACFNKNNEATSPRIKCGLLIKRSHLFNCSLCSQCSSQIKRCSHNFTIPSSLPFQRECFAYIMCYVFAVHGVKQKMEKKEYILQPGKRFTHQHHSLDTFNIQNHSIKIASKPLHANILEQKYKYIYIPIILLSNTISLDISHPVIPLVLLFPLASYFHFCVGHTCNYMMHKLVEYLIVCIGSNRKTLSLIDAKF